MYYSVYECLTKLKETPGKNDKLAFLMSQKENGLLREFFSRALNPYVQYYIKKIPAFEEKTNLCDPVSLQKGFKSLVKFSDRVVTGNAAQAALVQILETMLPEDADVYQRIIKKDPAVGCQQSTINKVWPGLIPTYPVMLCESYNEDNLARIRYPAAIQCKSDGARANLVVENGKVDAFGRSGKEFMIHGALDEEAIAIAQSGNVVLDGEFLVVDKDGKIMSRKAGNGILNKAIKGTISLEEASRIRFTVWDIIPVTDWKAGEYRRGYYERYEYLRARLMQTQPQKINLSETEIVNNYDQAWSFFKKMLARGDEGAILKNTDSIWEDRRSREQVKMKVEDECELIVVGREEGEKKNVGKLGALVCESSDGHIHTKVGSGFSAAQRIEYWSDDVIGSIITVKANDYVSAEKRETKALFLPIFIEVREEKDEADHSDQIIASFDEIYGRNS